MDRRCELIVKQFNKNNISKLLAVFGTSPFLLFPLLENLVQLQRRHLIVDDLSVFTGNVERLCNEIRDVFTEKHIQVKMTRIDFLGKI